MRSGRERIGIMGGMFDPVHQGHLQLARAVRIHAALDAVLLVPCGTPVHRGSAQASAEQRIAMLELALAGEQALRIDPRECHSSARSYTFDTLTAIRGEHPDAALFLVMGLDAFLQLHTWYRWQELFTLAHLVVAGRPGYRLQVEAMDAVLRSVAVPRLRDSLDDCADSTAGCVLLAELDTPALSSTAVRTLLQQGADCTGLLPPAVHEYIMKHGLYRQEETP